MKKVLDWLKTNKISIISILVLIAIFFIAISFLSNNYVKPIKKERDEIKKEKESLLKQIQSLNDSILFYEELSKKTALKDTIIINQIIKEKQKTNEILSVISSLPPDSNISLHSKLTQEYIQTGFTPDSSE